MARDARYPTRWQVVAVIVVAILILPMSAALGWLETNRPRVALVLFVAGYACVVGLVGFLAWTAWRMVLIAYRTHRDPAARSVASCVRTLLREPWPLYAACLFTVGTVGGLIHLVREAVRRAI